MHAKAYRTRRCNLTFLQVAPSLSLAPRFGLLFFASAHQCAVLAAGKGVLQAAAAAGPCRCSCCFAERDAGARVFVR